MGEKQIEQFIDDLRQANGQYYPGHFLFEKSTDEKTLYLIDGQQRLTTCVIFFSSLYKALKDRKDVANIDLDDIMDYYIKDLRKEIQKLETVDDDNNFFSDEIIDRLDIAAAPDKQQTQKQNISTDVLFCVYNNLSYGVNSELLSLLTIVIRIRI